MTPLRWNIGIGVHVYHGNKGSITLVMAHSIQKIRRWFRGHSAQTAAAGIAGLAVAGSVAGAATPSEAMSGYRWKSRPLVVFAPSNQSANLVRQKRIITANRAGFANRDMVIVTVVGDRVTSRFGRGPGMNADRLRKRYGVGRGQFRALLVGKDGGVKLSSGSAIGADRLFGLIDSMPMRRQEMRRRGR